MYKNTLVPVLMLIMLLLTYMNGYGGGRAVGAASNRVNGDSNPDTAPGDLNLRARGKKVDEFLTSTSLSFNIPVKTIEPLISKEKMTPADAYMTVGLSRLIDRPVGVVVGEYKKNKGKGWGLIAKRLGVNPGSREFRSLKKGDFSILQKGDGNNKQGSRGKNMSKFMKIICLAWVLKGSSTLNHGNIEN